MNLESDYGHKCSISIGTTPIFIEQLVDTTICITFSQESSNGYDSLQWRKEPYLLSVYKSIEIQYQDLRCKYNLPTGKYGITTCINNTNHIMCVKIQPNG
jgi:hypothetical protein